MGAFCMEIIAKLCCVGMLLFQGILLDIYLVNVTSSKWNWLWIIADVFVICIWIVTLVLAKRNFENRLKKARDNVDGGNPEDYPDEIRYSFIAWIVYILLLTPRVVIMMHKHASKLKEEDVLGPNYLKVAISSTPLIFLLLIYGYHNGKLSESRKYYIASLVGSVCLDLFDSIDLLEFLFIPEEKRVFPQQFLDASLAFSIINFFLPTLALIEIYVNGFTGRVTSLSFKVVYVFCYAFLINVPNLVIRSVLWHYYNSDVSVLIMKNVMCIALGVTEMCEYFGEDRPRKCENCNNWYRKSHFKKHYNGCISNRDLDDIEL